jgi:putative phosphoribosyl transferase
VRILISMGPASPAVTFHVPMSPFVLAGTLEVPARADALVLMVCAGGRSHPPRPERLLAEALHRAHLATGFVDLLTPEEQRTHDGSPLSRLELDVIAGRVVVVTDWLRATPGTGHLRLGYLGCGVNAGTALIAASERAAEVGAVVAPDGRPDKAGAALTSVRVPTLLIAGQRAARTVEANRRALDALTLAERRLEIIPGTRHTLRGRGGPERVGRLCADWFGRHLAHAG